MGIFNKRNLTALTVAAISIAAVMFYNRVVAPRLGTPTA